MADTILWIRSDVTGSVGNKDYPSYRNKTGFSARPSGCRLLSGAFTGLGLIAQWWTQNEFPYNPAVAWAGIMGYNGTYFILNGLLKNEDAYPVRCVRN